ncbi:MAG: cupin domain-containing protein [Bacteroidota bacterium]
MGNKINVKFRMKNVKCKSNASQILWVFTMVNLFFVNFIFAQNQIKSGVYHLAEAKKEPKETGYRRSILSGEVLDFKPFSAHYTTVNAGLKSHNPHKHATEELIIIKEGEITLTVEGFENHLKVGDVAIIKPNDMHGIVNNGTKKATYMVMIYENKNNNNSPAPKPEITKTHIIHWDSTAYKTHDLGGRRNFLDNKTAQAKRFEMHTTTLLKGKQSHPPHTHRAAEILVPIEGETEEYIDGQWIKADMGDIIFLESGSSHAIRNVGKKKCTYFAFQFE